MDGNWQGKSEIEKTIISGMHGSPQLRLEEKRRYLGFFRERLLEAVTFKQLRTKEGLRLVEQALKDPRAKELVIHSEARSAAMPLIKTARSSKIDFTVTTNPKFTGDVAVVVAAAAAVDIAKLLAETE